MKHPSLRKRLGLRPAIASASLFAASLAPLSAGPITTGGYGISIFAQGNSSYKQLRIHHVHQWSRARRKRR